MSEGQQVSVSGLMDLALTSSTYLTWQRVNRKPKPSVGPPSGCGILRIVARPSARVCFFRLAEEDSYLGPSSPIRRLWPMVGRWAYCGAFWQPCTGAPWKASPLVSLAVQYGDYVLQRNQPEYQAHGWADSGITGSNSWRSPAVLGARDRPRPAVECTPGCAYDGACPRTFVRPWNALLREEGVTPFVRSLPHFRCCWRDTAVGLSFCIGVPSAGRGRPELMFQSVPLSAAGTPGSITGRLRVRDLVRACSNQSSRRMTTPTSPDPTRGGIETGTSAPADAVVPGDVRVPEPAGSGG